jgi:hypothetical protein
VTEQLTLNQRAGKRPARDGEKSLIPAIRAVVEQSCEISFSAARFSGEEHGDVVHRREAERGHQRRQRRSVRDQAVSDGFFERVLDGAASPPQKSVLAR